MFSTDRFRGVVPAAPIQIIAASRTWVNVNTLQERRQLLIAHDPDPVGVGHGRHKWLVFVLVKLPAHIYESVASLALPANAYRSDAPTALRATCNVHVPSSPFGGLKITTILGNGAFIGLPLPLIIGLPPTSKAKRPLTNLISAFL